MSILNTQVLGVFNFINTFMQSRLNFYKFVTNFNFNESNPLESWPKFEIKLAFKNSKNTKLFIKAINKTSHTLELYFNF